MSVPKLIIGYGGDGSAQERIEALLRSHCHLDTLLSDRILLRRVDARDPWRTLMPESDIILHHSLAKGLRANIKQTKKPGYDVVVNCQKAEHFERILESRLKSLSLHWTTTVAEHLRHWIHDSEIDVKKIEAWANQFDSHLGGEILRCLRVIPANKLIPLTGISEFDCFDAIVGITDYNGAHSGSELILSGLMEGKRKEFGKLEELIERPSPPQRVLILADWLLSGRQILDYLSRSGGNLRTLNENGARFCLAAARITELAKVRVEQAVEILEIAEFKIFQPQEGFLPNLRKPLFERLDAKTLLPLEVIDPSFVLSELEMRLRQIGHSEELISKKIKVAEELGHQLVYPGFETIAEKKPKSWGLGNDGLGLTTLNCSTAPSGLLPVLWSGGPLHVNNKFKNWKPLIAKE